MKKQLAFKEAQELYKKMISSSSEFEKKELKEKIILGAMHVLYTLLKSSFLPYFPNGQIDVEDVISVSCEMWIEFVLKGQLLFISNYHHFFVHFYKNIKSRLYHNGPHKMQSAFGIQEEELYKLLTKYVLFRSKCTSFNEQDFENHFSKEIPISFYTLFETC